MKISVQRLLFIAPLFAMLAAGLLWSCQGKNKGPARVLVFTKTMGFRHASIPAGIMAVQKLGEQYGFRVDTTENAAYFTEDSLKHYNAVIFLSTTGDVLDHYQQADFERYIQSGGGYVGVHAASDTEYDWPWYGKLVGGYFESHPPGVHEAHLHKKETAHPATDSLPGDWVRTDEWYNFRDLNNEVKVLLTIDEKTYQGGKNGDNHPMSWFHEYDGGRIFYTALGHTNESYTESLFLKHLMGGIQYAIGDGKLPDYKKARSKRVPESNRFSKVVLDENLNEPMELDVLPDGNILFIERKGDMKLYDFKAESTRTVARLKVFTELEDGLLGLALDPGYTTNHWIYLFYSPVGKEHKQRVSRFVYWEGQLDTTSEKIVLEIPNQRDECCHSAGCLEFGPGGLLYISLGDNTNPFASEGFAPIDERPGRSAWDAQKSSANTKDLRGKILRIKPEADGTYSIPDGNLFPKDGSQGRPEIYVMGNRNPFRTSIDPKNGYLYWGEVGPDSNVDGPNRGPMGYDEVNQAKKAGFFGWPYFIANNKPYNDYDFTKSKSGEQFNPAAPINNSPNNTGIQNLPPAQPAFIWYPYGKALDFPIPDQGGRNAMAGPVYYSDLYPDNGKKLPDYYDGKVITYDWMRNWMFAVTLDKNGDFEKMEPFLSHLHFDKPVDMTLSVDGELYVLEYGTYWFARNQDARLSKIEYNAGNRKPVAVINTDKIAGALPLKISCTSEGSIDYDGDQLKYAWSVQGKDGVVSKEPNATFTFDKAGDYVIELAVSDVSGKTSKVTKLITAGNGQPEVQIALSGNQTFYWENEKIPYEVSVSDLEDGSLSKNTIDPHDVKLSIDYLETGSDMTVIAQGHEEDPLPPQLSSGRALIADSDCKACHGVNTKSIGPSYMSIANRYKNDKGAVSRLGQKIINGGKGVWGENAMAAHPQYNQEEAEQMAAYIISLGQPKPPRQGPPLSGSFTADRHVGKTSGGNYVMIASYRDKGAQGISPATGRQIVVLRSATLEAESHDINKGTGKLAYEGYNLVTNTLNGTYFGFKQLDLTGITQMVFHASCVKGITAGGTIEVHSASIDGPLIGQITLSADSAEPKIVETPCTIKAKPGLQDVYFVFKNPKAGALPVAIVDKISFQKGGTLVNNKAKGM